MNDIHTDYTIYLDSLIILFKELKEVRSKAFMQSYDLKFERKLLAEFYRLNEKSKKLRNVIDSLCHIYRQYSPTSHKNLFSFESYRNNIQNLIGLEKTLH